MSNETTPQDSAAMPPASAGSVCEPVAWAVMQPDSYSVFVGRRLAEKRQELCMGGDIIPLYREPKPTLTGAEREAVEDAISDAIAESRRDGVDGTSLERLYQRQAEALRGLLERLK